MEDLFATQFKTATEEDKNRATRELMKMFNRRAAAGKEPTEEEAPKLAQDAFRIARGLGPRK
jgi:hypothetical protein